MDSAYPSKSAFSRASGGRTGSETSESLDSTMSGTGRGRINLSNYQFTFESHLNSSDPSLLIEADPNPSSPEAFTDGFSLTSSISRYRIENGRTYHAYSDGSWQFPNDADELDRLSFQYHCIKNLFSGKNYLTPWSQTNPPRRILDIATGTGEWAMEMAQEFPNSKIIANDLSPVQPNYVEPNVHYYIEDARSDWDGYGEPFDYVHMRLTLGAWENFEKDIAHKAFSNMEPGGWFEAQELHPSICCDDDTMPADWPLKLLFEDLAEVTLNGTEYTSTRRPITIAETYKRGLENAGFVDVTEQIFKIPLNAWPKRQKYKNLGRMWEENFKAGLSGISMAPLHRYRNLTQEQIEIFLSTVRPCLSDQRVHAYQKFYVVTGRKPYPNEVEARTGTIRMEL